MPMPITDMILWEEFRGRTKPHSKEWVEDDFDNSLATRESIKALKRHIILLERGLEILTCDLEYRNDRIRELKSEMAGVIEELNAAKKVSETMIAERQRITEPGYLEID